MSKVSKTAHAPQKKLAGKKMICNVLVIQGLPFECGGTMIATRVWPNGMWWVCQEDVEHRRRI